jgi:hypothetical protein
VEYCPNELETVYGGGINPIGCKINLRRQRRFQVFGGISAGFVASVNRVPVDLPGGTRFNFTFDLQTGIERFNSARTHAWTFGYKLQYISNANRGGRNPGIDSNMVFLGYSFFK